MTARRVKALGIACPVSSVRIEYYTTASLVSRLILRVLFLCEGRQNVRLSTAAAAMRTPAQALGDVVDDPVADGGSPGAGIGSDLPVTGSVILTWGVVACRAS